MLRTRDVTRVGASVHHSAVAHGVHGEALGKHVPEPSFRTDGILRPRAGGNDSIVNHHVGLEPSALHLFQQHLKSPNVLALLPKGLGRSVKTHLVRQHLGLPHLSEGPRSAAHVVMLCVEVYQHIEAHGVGREALRAHPRHEGASPLEFACPIASAKGTGVADKVRPHALLGHALQALLRTSGIALPGVHAEKGVVALRRRL
mmetsp:Transcript_115461/g.321685  ORF Transcript_115461/g.321685 Transcript_115461/m.321685 type:complete len:202 (+) Transcript_115461:742-1347(+)